MGVGHRGLRLRRVARDALQRGGAGGPGRGPHPGRALQVDPIKPTLKAPGTTRLKLNCDGPLSKFAFHINLRRYTLAAALVGALFGAAAAVALLLFTATKVRRCRLAL